MLEFLESGKALTVFIAIGAIGIVSKLITRSLYKRLIKETDNMAMTKNRNLKILKQKLENACRLNQSIMNTQAYLDKQTYGFKFAGISLNGWNSLSLQMTILGLLAGGSCSFMSYWYRLDSYYIILYASVGALGSLLLTFLDSSFNISQKQQRLSNSLLEYADNSVFVRVVREAASRDTSRDFAAASREGAGTAVRGSDIMSYSQDSREAEKEREQLIRENDLKDGLVREEEPRRGGGLRNRNVKAEELLRTVRSMKKEEGSENAENRSTAPGRHRRSSQKSAVNESISEGNKSRFAAEDKEENTEVRRDIDYLKHSLDQIAASKEKPRANDDWAKNLDPEELKVIGEIMRQYFAGN